MSCPLRRWAVAVGTAVLYTLVIAVPTDQRGAADLSVADGVRNLSHSVTLQKLILWNYLYSCIATSR